MIVVEHIRAGFYSQNIQYDRTLMVPALFFEDMCPRLKKLTCETIGLIRSHGLLNYRWRDAVQLKLMLVPWLLT
jgi:hypothetical protein